MITIDDLCADDFQDTPVVVIPDETKCCGEEREKLDGCYICQKCGSMDISRGFEFTMDNVPNHSKRGARYRRLYYFRERLFLMALYKQPLMPEYHDLVIEMKEEPLVKAVKKLISKRPDRISDIFIENAIIRRLRGCLRLKGKHKMYRWVYSLIYDLFGYRLVNLTRDEITKLSVSWHKIETLFKHRNPDKTNMYTYNMILYHLLKRKGFGCYKFVLLPHNYHMYEKEIASIMDAIEREENREN